MQGTIGRNPLPHNYIPDLSSAAFAPHDYPIIPSHCVCAQCAARGYHGGCGTCGRQQLGGFDPLKYIPEIHIPGYNFCGPGTKLHKRLNPDGTPVYWSTPINKLDTICYQHDLAYNKHEDRVNRQKADRVMLGQIAELVNDPSLTLRERAEIMAAKTGIASKLALGLGRAGSRKKKKSKTRLRKRGSRLAR